MGFAESSSATAGERKNLDLELLQAWPEMHREAPLAAKRHCRPRDAHVRGRIGSSAGTCAV